MFMMQFLREFGSWYWDGELDEVEATAFEATGEARTPEEFRRLHLILLRSGNPAARGIALDFYDRAAATSRFGEANPFEPHLDEILEVARELLRRPPVASAKTPGASHASALLALKNDADEQDAPLVADVLEHSPEGALLDNALTTAGTVLARSGEPDARLVGLLRAIATDAEADVHDRTEAVRALEEVEDPALTELFAALAEGEGEQAVRDQAALALLGHRRFYEHRELLERLERQAPAEGRAWPETLIREAFAAGEHSLYWTGDEPRLDAGLAAALDEMRAPTGEAAHVAACRAMLHSGVPAAVGIALDHFHMDEGLGRFGIDVEEYAEETRAAARALLDGETEERARISALRLLEELAEPADTDLAVRVLRARDITPPVRERAARLAGELLEGAELAAPDLLAALEELIADESVEIQGRRLAVIALFGSADPAATELLLRAAASSEVDIQVEAAIGLNKERQGGRHLELLRELTASWPTDDPPDRAWLVNLPD
ncbi:hypothetical protein AB0I28_23490 [Phytomonospora sp. NPDC050363]|uniref:hypothetical protein n=1 Tax=Phytomonospora sp. NPDC050363 TaxID=3155642 RepID=UPI0033E0DA65